MASTLAFTTATPNLLATSFRGASLVCTIPPTPHATSIPKKTSQFRMQLTESVGQQTAPASWPPPEMTDEWAEAVLRLVNSVKGASHETADEALEEADGDEILALRYLMEDNRSDIQRRRERVVEEARAGGDINRISALKEAQLRRSATGSARDFFKGFVDVEGQYVDAGYVDESADTMGMIVGKVKGWFGKNE